MTASLTETGKNCLPPVRPALQFWQTLACQNSRDVLLSTVWRATVTQPASKPGMQRAGFGSNLDTNLNVHHLIVDEIAELCHRS
eukprot:1160217-Pelagomonas_calceolata.AAC.8